MLSKFNLSHYLFRLSGLLLVATLTVSLLTACGSNNDTSATMEASAEVSASPDATKEVATENPDTRLVKDELGHEITIPVKPLRVFAPYLEDSLLTLGVIPVAQWANGDVVQEYLQDQLQDVPKVDFIGGLPPAPETVLAFQPDLIILHTASYAQNGVYENYSKIAPTYVFNKAAGDLENSVMKLGDILGKSTEAEQALQSYKQKVSEAKVKLAPFVEGKKAALINFSGKSIFMMGGNYFGGYVLSHDLEIAKSKLVETEDSLNLSMEIIPQIDADYIFTVNNRGINSALIKETTESTIWTGMPATKSGHVYEVDYKYWTGSGLIAYGKIVDDVVRFLVHE